MDLKMDDFVEKPQTATAPTETGAQPEIPQAQQQTRKRRGRPFGTRNAVPPLQEQPIGVDGEPPQQEQQTRRRRTKQIDIDALAKQLRGIHALGAQLLPIRVPDGQGGNKLLMELSDTEATQLANAISGVAKEYDLALDGKTGAAIQLFAAAAMIYGPRVYVIQKMRQSMQRSAQEAPPSVDPTVVAEQMRSNGTAASAH